jgi:hypothetical protein
MGYTEKEVILRERAAYSAGHMEGRTGLVPASYVSVRVSYRYPLPKVRRNRVVVLESGVMRFRREVEWNAYTKQFTVKLHHGDLLSAPHAYNALRLAAVSDADADDYFALLLDLQKNPTELVDAE